MNNLRNLKLIGLVTLLVNVESYTAVTANNKLTDAQRDQLLNNKLTDAQKAQITNNRLTPAKQMQIAEMLERFLDITKDQSKGFEQWIDDLKNLIQQEPEFAMFFPVLNSIRNQRNANVVKLEILKNRSKAPQFVQEILSKKPISELANILTTRVNRRNGK